MSPGSCWEGKLLHGSSRGDEITRLFQQDKTRLADYNLKDCELVSEIFAHTAMLDFAVARTVMTGLNIDRMGGSVASLIICTCRACTAKGSSRPMPAAITAPAPVASCWIPPRAFTITCWCSISRACTPASSAHSVSTRWVSPSARVECWGNGDGARLPGGALCSPGHILPELIQQLWRQRTGPSGWATRPVPGHQDHHEQLLRRVLGTPGCRFFDARPASSITAVATRFSPVPAIISSGPGHQVIFTAIPIRSLSGSRKARMTPRRSPPLAGSCRGDLNHWWRETVWAEFGWKACWRWV